MNLLQSGVDISRRMAGDFRMGMISPLCVGNRRRRVVPEQVLEL